MDMDDLQHKQDLIQEYKKHLRALEKQAARYGIHVPSYIEVEIEEIKQKIRILQRDVSESFFDEWEIEWIDDKRVKPDYNISGKDIITEKVHNGALSYDIHVRLVHTSEDDYYPLLRFLETLFSKKSRIMVHISTNEYTTLITKSSEFWHKKLGFARRIIDNHVDKGYKLNIVNVTWFEGKMHIGLSLTERLPGYITISGNDKEKVIDYYDTIVEYLRSH